MIPWAPPNETPKRSGHRHRIPLVCTLLVLTMGACSVPKKHDEVAADIRALNLPDVRYTLGHAPFDSLFDAVVAARASVPALAVHEKIKVCRSLFVSDRGPAAMSRTGLALADALELGPGPAEDLLRAEALHWLTRCFFYLRVNKFEPGTSLLERAIAISGRLAHHTDTAVQQVALYQYARHHDVMQGFTHRYGLYVEQHEPRAWTFASRTALHIKTGLLGLRGAPILRSISNLAIDQSGLCLFGDTGICKVIELTAVRGIRELPWLSPEEFAQYGEFVSASVNQTWGYYERRHLHDSLSHLLELLIGNLVGNTGYRLGDRIGGIRPYQGPAHFLTSVPGRLEEYIQLTGKEEFRPSLLALEDTIAAFVKRRYVEAAYDEGRIWKFLANVGGNDKDPEVVWTGSPIGGEPAYRALLGVLRAQDMQSRQYALDDQQRKQDPAFDSTLKDLRRTEAELRHAEFAIGRGSSPAALRHLAGLLDRDHELRQQVNRYRAAHAPVPVYRPLGELQSALRPNEVWVAYHETSDNGFLGVCTKDTLLVTRWDLQATDGPDGRRNGLMVRLRDRIMKGGPWGPEQERELVSLSRAVFGDHLPAGTTHVVLHSSGRDRTILEPLLMASVGGSLRSIRSSCDLHMQQGSVRKPKGGEPRFTGVAPRFRPYVDTSSSDGAIAALIDRMKQAGNGMSRAMLGPLEHNVDEVEQVQALVGGTVLVEDSVTEGALMSGLHDPSGILHLATHSVVLAADVDRSGLVLNEAFNDDPASTEDQVWRVNEIRASEVQASLVVLSACATSTAAETEIGAQYSIATAFLEAGCPNVVSTLWDVDDRSTHDIVIEFYRQLRMGKGKATALYEAKRIYRERNPGKGPHYWAPLMITGDDEPLFAVPDTTASGAIRQGLP